MMTPPNRTPEDFVTLFRYNHWANNRVLDALRGANGLPGRVLELLSHLLRAQDIWYGRVEDTEHADLDLWRQDDLSACVERAEASTQRWTGVLDARSPSDLDHPIAYTNSSGTAFETPLRDILTHVVNHSTHHRAQIALVLRRAGFTPPETDYIFYVREE